MFQHFLTLAYRRLRRPNAFLLINTLGLTLGTACALYILFYVLEQYRYDRHNEDADQIYRVVTDIRQADDGLWQTATCSPPIAPALQADFPEVALAARLVADHQEKLLRYRDLALFVDNGYYVDSTFFQLFTYRFVEGTPKEALQEPYTVVLTRSLAARLFGEEKAYGREIELENGDEKHLLRVTGVVDDAWGKSHIRGNFYLSMNSGGIGEYVATNDQWAGNNFIYAYIRLAGQVDPAALAAKLPAFLERHGSDQLKESSMDKQLHLEPLRRIHLYSQRENQVETTAKAGFLHLLLTIAVLIQLIACINFMNLTTARAMQRAREVGVRKVVGAGRSALVGQFLSESMLLAALAVGLALPLLNALWPRLNALAGAAIDPVSQQPGVWWLLVGIALATGLLAGMYPAFYQSSFRPLDVFKGRPAGLGSAVGLRKTLVVFQFIISIGLIVGVVVINGQMRFVAAKDLGFASDHKLLLPLRTPEARSRQTALHNELRRLPQVTNITAAAICPGQFIPFDRNLFTSGKGMDQSLNVKYNFVDDDYLRTLNIPLLDGRNFTSSDTLNQVIVNETLLRQFGIPREDAIGSRLHSLRDGQEENFEIIGLMRDFHFRSLYDEITPFMLFRGSDARPSLSFLIVNADTPDVPSLNSQIRSIWEQMIPQSPFEFSFLDDNLKDQYRADFSLLSIIESFTAIALLISCLGLLGLSVFNAEQRVKEIGIRKVLGASVAGIVGLLSRDFLRLVALAALIAFPLAGIGMSRWLDNFAYRITLQWWMFALAGASAVLIALLTVGAFAWRAARANPVRALRNE